MIRRVSLAIACLAGAAQAELKDEAHWVGDMLVEIGVFDTLEIMTVGPNAYERMQVLSGGDVEIAAFGGDPDAVALVGAPVLVASVTGTHTCEDVTEDALDYYVITLGNPPAPEGPVTSCGELAVSFTNGAVVLEGDPMGDGTSHLWSLGKGFQD